jgi:DNA-3-methyladenine glycosylase
MKKLPLSFYKSDNVLQIAQALLGKILVTKWEGVVTAGRIVETEAYNGVIDKASHASGGRRTARNEVMYAAGGIVYVYLCYGIHYLFNVVTNRREIPHAILIRAVEPVKGITAMEQRTGKKMPDYSITKGPGNVAKALGLHIAHSGQSLGSRQIFIADDGCTYSRDEWATSPRIGVDYAGKDALLPYRFYVKGNLYVSGKREQAGR